MRSLEGLEPGSLYEAGEVAIVGLAAYLAYSRALWKRRYNEATENNRLDPKTGLLTYVAFKEEVARRTQSTQRSRDVGRSHGLIIADIDDFKLWNTRLTHPVTDKQALLPVANTLKRAVRPDTDLVARFGGEEFLIFLSDVDTASIENVCLRLQHEVNTIQPDTRSTDSIGLTIVHTTFEQGSDCEEVFTRLSASALKAKEIPGKNQIVDLNATS